MNIRFKIILFIFLFIAMLWLVYLFIIQIYDPFNLAKYTRLRYNAHKELIIPNRGNIYDENGALIVSSMKYYQIDIDKQLIAKIAEKRNLDDNFFYNRIADIISENSDMNKTEVLGRLKHSRANSVMISNQLNETQIIEIKKQLETEHLDVLTIAFSSMKRVYTKGRLAARLLGVVTDVQDESNLKNRYTYRMEGLSGIESTYDEFLKGEAGWREAVYDAKQDRVTYPNLLEKPVVDGASVYLTINSEIQQILENNLNKGLKRYSARNAIGVIMNPQNGDVLAMAGINKDDYKFDDNTIRSFQNMPLQFIYEPGSTIKPFVSLYALEHNLVKPTDIFNCKPIVYSNNLRTIKDSHDLGIISFKDVIVHSSNIGIALVAEKIGEENLYNHYVNFGFGHKTGVVLFDESSGIFRKPSEWSSFTLHSVSFGQEIAINTLQLANAYCVLANGGELLRPNIVKKIVDNSGHILAESKKQVIRKLSNPEDIKLNNSFLLDVVERGTGLGTKFEKIKIAGKTGTSEKSIGTGYSKDHYISSFVGFFPYENPQYVMVIVYDEPEYKYRFGSSSAVPTFRSVTEDILALPDCNVIPDLKMNEQEIVTMPNLIGLKISDAKKILKKNSIDYQIYNDKEDSFVVRQFPNEDVKFGKKNKVTIVCSKDITDFNNNRQAVIQTSLMPNLYGMPLRKAILISKALKIDLLIEGNGHIVKQSIQPGNPVKYQQICKVVAQ
ncbi:MAG: penicillin-binding transpeptidase domain-containing protein [Candidatus Cloacimonetes bacterium]|nr:penicillin-binding transpeptidase domain-containing protein [Candidatus Cloacimonadota bacterium]